MQTREILLVIVSLAVAIAAFIDYLKNRLMINGYQEIIRYVLQENQDEFVETTSEKVVEAIVPNVDLYLMAENLFHYIVLNHKDELISKVSKIIADKVEVVTENQEERYNVYRTEESINTSRE